MQNATYMLFYIMMALEKGLFIFSVSKPLIQAANKRPYASVLSGLPGLWPYFFDNMGGTWDTAKKPLRLVLYDTIIVNLAFFLCIALNIIE
ncbi:MAG: hypothetical protein JSW20_10405 [Nitrospiraceae bacterium]|nr:MAG: hypothetical protein JSW20_10405 [Nitrospiraceae bacterium]